MKRNHSSISIFAASVFLIILIFDSETAKNGVSAGIEICLSVIIPSLFPFLFITSYLSVALSGRYIPVISFVAKKLHIPSGGENILFLGLLGGYPVGAQLISENYRTGTISKRTALILLGYCSNAGPAFILGITPLLFESPLIPLCLWAIHIFSALMTGFLLPYPIENSVCNSKHSRPSMVQALRKSIQVSATICGWVIIFKIILLYLDKIIIGSIFEQLIIPISGFMELSNGCINLIHLEHMSLRFVLCAAFLAFGGLCVFLQTLSITASAGTGLYLPGKMIQTCISIITALLLSYLLFPASRFSALPCFLITIASFIMIIVFRYHGKKVVENHG